MKIDVAPLGLELESRDLSPGAHAPGYMTSSFQDGSKEKNQSTGNHSHKIMIRRTIRHAITQHGITLQPRQGRHRVAWGVSPRYIAVNIQIAPQSTNRVIHKKPSAPQALLQANLT